MVSPLRIEVAGEGLEGLDELHDHVVDDRGDIVAYAYKSEDAVNVDPAASFERHRLPGRFANRYLKHLRYGNQTPFQPGDWHFQLVFDYGEYDEIVAHHPGRAINQWQFGDQLLETNVYVFGPPQTPKYEVLHLFDYREQAGYAHDAGLAGGQEEIKGESAQDIWEGWENRDWTGWSALEK